MRLFRSHRHDLLWEELLLAIDERADVLEPIEIATPDRSTERAIELFVARRRGIVGNVRFTRLERVVAEWLEARTGRRPADRARWEALLLVVLFDEAELARPELAAVRAWVEAASPEVRAARQTTLATRLAELFTAYDRTRPGLVLAWTEGRSVPPELLPEASPLAVHHAWQRALALRARARGEAPFVAELCAAPAKRAAAGPLHVLLPAAPPETMLRALASIAGERKVTVLALDPCREFWEDALSQKEARRLGRPAVEPREDTPDESALLAAWGRTGRQTLGALYELSDWTADERFDDDAPAHALAEVQRSIVERRAITARAPDGSLAKILAPSRRREVEAVASDIWQRVADGARFSDVAVLFPDPERDRYLPLVLSVFFEARQLPFSSSDVPFVEVSAVAAAARALIEATASDLTRSRLLDLVLSSRIRAHLPDARPSAWAALLDRLGFFRGLTEDDAGGRGGDLEQALDRMALGAVAPGERSLVLDPVGGRFAEEIDAGHDETGGLYVLLRSLAADLKWARGAQLSLEEWSRFFGAMLTAYVHAAGPRDEAELLRVRATLSALERRHVEGARYPVRVAHDLLLRELEGERTELGAPGAFGVTVGGLWGHRGLGARHVYVLGLGEGSFGGPSEGRGLDVARASRQRLDEAEGERDRYLFLETLLGARSSLTVSWVARDEASGEALEPSPVLAELFEAAGALFTARTPRLRRHEDRGTGPWAEAALPGAIAEARAQALGERERGELYDGPAGAGLYASAFARLVQPDDPRRALLRWDAVSSAPRAQAPSGKTEGAPPRRLGPRPAAPKASAQAAPEIRVRLAEIRAFLERPMQAAAEHALGLSSRSLRERLDEPPIAMEPAVLGRVLADAVRHALDGGELGRFLGRRVRREQARGVIPTGSLGRRAERELEERAAALVAAARVVVPTGSLRPFRLGPGRAVGEEHEIALPPLALGTASSGAAATVLGESHAWLASDARALVVLDPSGAARSDERRARARTERALLRAFVDHAALSVLGSDAPGGSDARAVHVVTGAGTRSARLMPFEAGSARAWLRLLAAELSAGHAAFLPVEVILADRERIARGAPDVLDALERALEKARTKDDRLGELFGPVRDAKERPAPERPELLRIVGQRFGPFFDHVRI